MMYDYESELVEFWGKSFFFFWRFILIWLTLVFYFIMYSPSFFLPLFQSIYPSSFRFHYRSFFFFFFSFFLLH